MNVFVKCEIKSWSENEFFDGLVSVDRILYIENRDATSIAVNLGNGEKIIVRGTVDAFWAKLKEFEAK